MIWVEIGRSVRIFTPQIKTDMNTPVSLNLDKLLLEKGIDMPVSPTIADVVMWLYKKHGIWISVDMVFDEHQTGFWHCIRQSKIDDIAIQSDDYLKITEAYEAAIEYTLNNLI